MMPVGNITSRANPLVQEVKKLARRQHRDRSGRFLVEGAALFREAVQACQAWPRRFQLETVFLTEALTSAGEVLALFEQLPPGGRLFYVSEPVMAAMSPAVTPPGLLAVVARQECPPAAATAGSLLLLDQIRDPGNVGTLIRTAEATGFDQVWSLPGTADFFSPKVVRATMGSFFRVELRPELTADELAGLKSGGRKLLAASAVEGEPYYCQDFRRPVILVLGNEAQGISSALAELVDDWVRVPMAGRVESLNVAVAGAVIMFESARQRGLLEAPPRNVL